MANILITSAGRRVSLVKAFKKELKKISPSSKVFASDALPELSAAVQIADAFFQTIPIKEANYIDDLLNRCIEKNISLIIPTIDTELLLLSKNIGKFLSYNIQVVVSNTNFVEISNDKLRTHTFFDDYGIDTAKIYKKNNYRLPIYIKPINGSSSINNFIVKDENDLTGFHLNNDSLCFFEYLDHDLYDEYTCDLYYNKAGYLKCAIPRKRLKIRGGEISKGITKKNSIKKFIEDNLLKINGARGCITLQVFLDKETEQNIKGIEINARFGGGYPLSYLAGGNFPKWILKEYLLNEDIEYFNDWEEDLLMLRYDDEILIHNYEE